AQALHPDPDQIGDKRHRNAGALRNEDGHKRVEYLGKPHDTCSVALLDVDALSLMRPQNILSANKPTTAIESQVETRMMRRRTTPFVRISSILLARLTPTGTKNNPRC